MKRVLEKIAIAGCICMLLTSPWVWDMPLVRVISSLLCLTYFVLLIFHRQGAE